MQTIAANDVERQRYWRSPLRLPHDCSSGLEVMPRDAIVDISPHISGRGGDAKASMISFDVCRDYRASRITAECARA